MRLLDTNIFMYAVGRPHRWKAPCAEILQEVTDGSAAWCVDVEALQELLYVYSARGERARGLQVVRDLQLLFPAAIPITPQDIATARELMEAYHFLLPRDAIHAGIVVNHSLEGIVSTDLDFDRVKEIRRFDP